MEIPDKPLMSDAEIELLKRHAPLNGKVLEFGCGGSTALFCKLGIASLVSVESDLKWLENVAKAAPVRSAMTRGKWTPLHANIGDTGDLGAPACDSSPQLEWLSYHQFVWKLMPRLDFDFILVDGRFRVACVLQSLIHCSNKNVLLFVHDFWPREFYHSLLDFTELTGRADSAALLKRKTDTNWVELCKVLQQNSFIFL